MLSISHALTGAFIATKLGDPILYTPTIVASHYFEDWIPHWDVGTGLTNGLRTRKTAFILGVVELAIGLGLVFLFWYPAGTKILITAGIGAFLGLLPDFLAAPKTFLKWQLPFLKPLDNLHKKMHHSAANIFIGLTPQVLLWGLFWLLK
jgi:hypothetical protein